MKTFRLIILVLVGMAVISAGPATASGGKAKEKPKAEASTYGVKAISAGSENFLQFYPTAATIFSGYKPMGLMHFEYGLDIEDSRIRARATKLAPRLRDAYGRILAQYAGSLYTPGDVPDVNYLIVRMQSVTDRIMGKGNARFLVSTLMVREN